MFVNDWAISGLQGMLGDFQVDPDEFTGTVLYATYTYEDYSGSAFVLFVEDGNLYEVHGSHCSCFGLEDQWDPEETTPDAIRLRGPHGWDTPDIYQEVMDALDKFQGMYIPPVPLDETEVKEIWW